MSSIKRIPIKAAKEVAEKYHQDQVVLMCFDRTLGLTHVVTYGKTIKDCEQAAIGGNRIKKEILKWPDSLCKAKPARVKARELKVKARELSI